MALRVLLLSDGKPGHFRQSETVVAALSRRLDVDVQRLELAQRLPRWLVARVWKAVPSKLFLPLMHGIRTDGMKADLIVSAGAATLGASGALADLFGAPNVFAGSRRSAGAHRMALILTPYAKEAGRQNTAYELKPSPVDPDLLPPAPPWTVRPEHPALSLLLGGPTAQVRFRDRDWHDLASIVGELRTAWQARWTIVSSRRTPRAAYAAFEPLMGVADIRFVDYRTAGAGSIGPALTADALFATSDSLSMISEAVAARRPVIVIEPKSTRPTADAEAVQDMQSKRILAVFKLQEASPETIALALGRVKPMAENHLDRLAETLVSRLGLQR